MRHVAMVFFILALVAAAGVILWRISSGGCATNGWNLGFAGGALLLAVGLALPTDLKTVLDTVSSAKLPKIGGAP